MVIIQERLAQIAAIHIKSGKHDYFEQGACTMEIVAYVAGEEWSDSPTCACPVISVFMRLWNDGLRSDEERDRLLKPLISQLVDSKSTPVVELRRSFLALDWLIRVYTPKWLDLVPSLALHAKELRDMEEIADPASATAARAMVLAAGASAEAAAEAAAVDAAGAAARDALKPTTEFLQQSALDLVERMLAVGCNQENLRGT